MADDEDEVVVEGVAARSIEPGRVSVTSDDTADDTVPSEVLVPAGVGVPGADDVEFAAALVAVLLRRGATLPALLDASATIAADPELLSEVTERLEVLWEGEP
jgi:hypothetical protein